MLKCVCNTDPLLNFCLQANLNVWLCFTSFLLPFCHECPSVQCMYKSQQRWEKKWNAAVFIIFHHQLFTTLFTGPKKHFTCRRQGGNPRCWVLFKWVDSVICAQAAFHVNGAKNLEKCSGWLFIRSHQTLVNPKTNCTYVIWNFWSCCLLRSWRVPFVWEGQQTRRFKFTHFDANERNRSQTNFSFLLTPSKCSGVWKHTYWF